MDPRSRLLRRIAHWLTELEALRHDTDLCLIVEKLNNIATSDTDTVSSRRDRDLRRQLFVLQNLEYAIVNNIKLCK